MSASMRNRSRLTWTSRLSTDGGTGLDSRQSNAIGSASLASSAKRTSPQRLDHLVADRADRRWSRDPAPSRAARPHRPLLDAAGDAGVRVHHVAVRVLAQPERQLDRAVLGRGHRADLLGPAAIAARRRGRTCRRSGARAARRTGAGVPAQCATRARPSRRGIATSRTTKAGLPEPGLRIVLLATGGAKPPETQFWLAFCSASWTAASARAFSASASFARPHAASRPCPAGPRPRAGGRHVRSPRRRLP